MEKKKLLYYITSKCICELCKMLNSVNKLTSEEQSKAKKRINIEQNEKRVLSYFAVNENYQEEF